MKFTTFLKLAFSGLAVGLLAIQGCSNANEDANSETAISGTAEVLVDSEIYDLMMLSKPLYDAANPKATVTLTPVSGQEAAERLLTHDARVIVLGRDWSAAEKEVVEKQQDAEGYPRTKLANDAVVFYVNKNFPLDTLNTADIEAWLSGGEVAPDVYPELKKKPRFLVPGSQSSVYTNVTNVVLNGKNPGADAIFSLGNKDSVRQWIYKSQTDIGIGLLSQFVGDSSVKLLRLGFDSSGVYIRPKPVHAAYLIMGQYPYPVPIYAVLQNKVNPRSLPSGYVLFVARDAKAQRTFFDAGIEPDYAKFELILSE